MLETYPLQLVIGGARSGKSRYAESLFEAYLPGAVYIATAQAFDDEMRERIAVHQRQRGDLWETVEAPMELASTVEVRSASRRPILVDCLTLWLTNVMLSDGDVGSAVAKLTSVLKATQSPVVLVSNEVGLGIVPDTPLGRAFRDAQGQLNQSIAAIADRVVFLAAGLPWQLKPQLGPSLNES
ncbi:MAG: bifunctional adenosylcobinamide kinase/adenosylcobinamide-phosphate guanylyltransferase [Pseudomonadota bacterium]